MPTLVLSARHSEDNQALWRAAIRAGWSVERIQGIRVPAEVHTQDVVLYVESLFAPAIAQQLGVELLEAPEDWLVRLPDRYRQRAVRLTTLGEARRLTEPSFVKPPNDKSFPAQVYASGAALPLEFEDRLPVLVAEPVQFEAEYRCFVLDRQVRTSSPYLRGGRLAKLDEFDAPAEEWDAALAFAGDVLADTGVQIPEAVVLDVGHITGRGWAVVELNAAWGSGIYGCDPHEVLYVLQRVTRKPRPTS